MAWVESHQEIGKHPKTKRAARLVGVSIPTMVGHLHLIWHYALDFAQEGDVTHLEAWQIEDAALWEGEEGRLHAALIEAGFINEDENGVRSLHDWHDYAGKLIERRRADSERKRKTSTPIPPKPSGNQADTVPNSDGIPMEIQRNSDGKRADSVENPSVTLTVTKTITESPHGDSGAGAPGDDYVDDQQSETIDPPKPLPEHGPAQKLVAWWCRKVGVDQPARYGKAVGAAQDLIDAGIKTEGQAEELYTYCLTILDGGVTLNAMLSSHDSFVAAKGRPPRPARPGQSGPPRAPTPPPPRGQIAQTAEEVRAREASFRATMPTGAGVER